MAGSDCDFAATVEVLSDEQNQMQSFCIAEGCNLVRLGNASEGLNE